MPTNEELLEVISRNIVIESGNMWSGIVKIYWALIAIIVLLVLLLWRVWD